MNDRVVLHGIGVSSGTAAGLAVRITPAAGVDVHEPACTDVEADGQRVRDAFSQVAEGLLARAEKAPEASKAILSATAGLARDKALIKGVDKQLKKGLGVTAAVHEAVEVYAGKLRKIGGYMAERVTDLYDIRDRAIARLRGVPEPGVPELSEPAILVAHDLAPAETATLSPETVLGIVTAAGGPTSHTAILAAQLGIPAAVQVAGVEEHLEEGTQIALDGGVGEVIVNPTDTDTNELELSLIHI